MNRPAGELRQPEQPQQSESGLPLLLWWLAGATVLANIGGVSVAGYRASGLAWSLSLALAFIVVMRNPALVAFPLWTWALWILTVVVYGYQSRFPSLQRTVQMLCPIVMGCAASTFRLDQEQLRRFVTMLKGLSVAMVAIVVLLSGILETGSLPLVTGLAPQVMTTMMLGCFFAASYADSRRSDLSWWLAMAAMPVFAVTRTAIVATALTLPLTFAPLKIGKRVVLVALIAVIGFGLFHTQRIQGKMFKSGSGEMTDVLDKDFEDSGRFYLWGMLKEGIRDKPWQGHGTGAGEVLVKNLTAGVVWYPHNDWLLTLYDCGIVGTAAFSLSMLLAAVHALLCAGRENGVTRLLLFTGASAFIPFAILMYTDNIMVYTSYFGNLHFTILGLGYGAARLRSGAAPAEAAPGD